MKKIKYLLLIIPFLFIGSVRAATIDYIYDPNSLISHTYSHAYSDINHFLEDFTSIDKSSIDELVRLADNKYNESYSSEYPYYLYKLAIWSNTNSTGPFYIGIYVSLYTSIPSFSNIKNTSINYFYQFSTSDSTYIFNTSSLGISPSDLFSNTYYNPLAYYKSNFDLVFDISDIYNVNKDGSLYKTFENGDIIEPSINITNSSLVEVNLNDYPYIALSLKDYSKTNSFDVSNYVKGQYCLTPVYDYGLKERKEVLSGTQVERCSPYYTDYTLVRTTILDSDLKNHSIYYLKAYDTSKENKVKIDTGVFNIHYITEEEKDNPILNINGTKYSSIPFDSLTDTSNKSEDEGYVSGAVQEFNFSDIFSAPLDFLKGIWSSVTQIFVVIAEFISLLPEPLQYFFYISFMLAIILGLIKIIL